MAMAKAGLHPPASVTRTWQSVTAAVCAAPQTPSSSASGSNSSWTIDRQTPVSATVVTTSSVARSGARSPTLVAIACPISPAPPKPASAIATPLPSSEATCSSHAARYV
jgi:hypothetical protein